MKTYAQQIAEAVQTAVLCIMNGYEGDEARIIAIRDLDIDSIIASVPRPEPVGEPVNAQMLDAAKRIYKNVTAVQESENGSGVVYTIDEESINLLRVAIAAFEQAKPDCDGIQHSKQKEE